MNALVSQLLIGLINGCFYAILSLGLAVIFGMLGLINFAHGAMFMLGAFAAWAGLVYFEINYWVMLLLAPLVIGLVGALMESSVLRRVYKADHLYALLLTLGIALVIEEIVRTIYGISGFTYLKTPIRGIFEVDGILVPKYRVWVIFASLIVCALTWYGIEKTKFGSYLRAATEDPDLVETFGINVRLLRTVTYGCGVALAAYAGVLAIPVMQINPLTGRDLIIVIFAIVVIGGMGSIKGTILVGIGLGLIEGLVRVFYPHASSMTVFLLMVLVLIARPYGLFGDPE